MKLTEKEKMEQGLWYDANYDEELLKHRFIAEELCFDRGLRSLSGLTRLQS